jgi:hypothetical protein
MQFGGTGIALDWSDATTGMCVCLLQLLTILRYNTALTMYAAALSFIKLYNTNGVLLCVTSATAV